MSEQDQNIAIVKKGYAAFSAGELLRRMAENGTTVGPLRLFAGAHETMDALREAVAARATDISPCAGWKEAPMLNPVQIP